MNYLEIAVIGICLSFVIGSCSKSCTMTSESNLKIERERGYKDGLEKGKKAAEKDYYKKYEKLKADYDSQFERNKKIFEEKVSFAYKEGELKGTEEMTAEINSVMTINTEKKNQAKRKAKQNWNSVISTGEE